jgi:alpha/beta superfamily hydrolase
LPAGLPGTRHRTVDVTTLDYEAVPGVPLVAVLLHPHPDMGGDRFNHVVDAIYRALPPAGVSVARFDLSSSDPRQAHADTLLAIDMIGATRVALVGYSFGADVALGLADSRIAGWFAVAPPLRFGGFAAISSDARPKVLLVPELDQFSGPARVSELTSGWSNVSVTTLGGADHFLQGHSDAVAEAVRRWVADLASADQTG